METLFAWWENFGLLAVVMIGGFGYLGHQIKRLEVRLESVDAAVIKHEVGCQEDRVRRAGWEGQVQQMLKAGSRRMASIERKIGDPGGFVPEPEATDINHN